MPAIKSSAELRNNYNEISSFCHTYAEFVLKNPKAADDLLDEAERKIWKHLCKKVDKSVKKTDEEKHNISYNTYIK